MTTSPTPLHLLTFSQFQSSSLEQQKSIFNQFQAVVVKANRSGCCEVKEMPELPVEIQEMIWGFLDRDGLARCCRLSQYHDGLFRKTLWHKIQLSERVETISFLECLEGLSEKSRARFMECVKELELLFIQGDPKVSGLVSELFEMEEWDLLRNLERLTIVGAEPLPTTDGDEPLCWSVPLSQLTRLKSLVLQDFDLSDFNGSRVTPIWPDLTSLRLSFVNSGVTSLFDRTVVPNLRPLTIESLSFQENVLPSFLPLAAQIQTLSIPSHELLRPTAGQGQPITYASILPLFTGLTALHLYDWDLKVMESISALPNLQNLLLQMEHLFHSDYETRSEEVMEYLTNSQEEWLDNINFNISTWGTVSDGNAKFERVLKSRGVRLAFRVHVEGWLERFKMKE